MKDDSKLEMLYEAIMRKRDFGEYDYICVPVTEDEVILSEFPGRFFAYEDVEVDINVRVKGKYYSGSRYSPPEYPELIYYDARITHPSDRNKKAAYFEIFDEHVDELNQNDPENSKIIEKLNEHAIKRAEKIAEDQQLEPDPVD